MQVCYYITFSFEITSSCCPWLKNVSFLSSLMVKTVADIVTVGAVALVVAAGIARKCA